MRKVVIEDPHRLLKAMNQILAVLKEVGFGQPSYGFFYGGDPRHFTPDEEATKKEMAQWKADCEAFANGEKGPTPSSCSWNNETLTFPNKEGTLVDHQPGTVLLTKSFYGLGINLNTEEQEIFAALVYLKQQLEISVRSVEGEA